MKRVAILQSNYIPWKGYFDIIGSVDEFVLYDDVQYTRRDWRNRNKIKTADGLSWLTVPVETKGRYHELIKDIRISDPGWAKKHWQSIRHSYAKAPFFDWCAEWLEPLYEKAGAIDMLSSLNHMFLSSMAERLGIRTAITWSMDYKAAGCKSDRLLDICLQAGASVYISGPAAQCYLDVELFSKNGIAVEWMSYAGYPEYEQLYLPFEHGVSIVDLFMNTGSNATEYMKYTRRLSACPQDGE